MYPIKTIIEFIADFAISVIHSAILLSLIVIITILLYIIYLTFQERKRNEKI